MPRGKRKTALESITEQLTQIETQIEAEHGKLKALESKKAELLKLKKNQELDDQYEKNQDSGKSVDEILSALDKK